MKKTCSKCAHFGTEDIPDGWGTCALTLDSNDYTVASAPTDRIYGWDYEGYMSGAYVGKDFGCIHWTKENAA